MSSWCNKKILLMWYDGLHVMYLAGHLYEKLVLPLFVGMFGTQEAI